MDVDADMILREYFSSRKKEITEWFNIISPANGTLEELVKDIGRIVKSSTNN